MKLFDIVKFYAVAFGIIAIPLLFIDVNTMREKYEVSFDYILIYSLYSISIITTYFIIKRGRIRKDHLNYVALLQLLSLFYAVSCPLSIIIAGRLDPSNIGYYLYKEFNENYVIQVVLLFILFQIGIAIGSIFQVTGFKKLDFRFSTKRAIPICWIMLIASTLPYLLIVAQGGITMNREYIDVFNELNNAGRVSLYLGFFRLLPTTILLFFYIYNKKHKGVGFVFLIVIISTLIKPSRGFLLSTIIVTIISYNYFNNYISIKKLLGIAMIFLLLSISIVTIRSRSELSWNIAKNVSEGNAMFENTYVIYDYMQNSGTFRLGKDYFSAPLRFVPHWLFPIKKNQSLSIWLMDTFYPGMREKGGGRMFSIVAEGYLNFGLAGPLLFGIVLSIIFKKLYLSTLKIKAHMDRKTIHLIPIFYIFLCGQIYYLLRGDIISFAVRILLQAILPLFVLFIFARLIPKNETKN